MEKGISTLREIVDIIAELVLKEKDTELKARLRKQSREVNAAIKKITENESTLEKVSKEELTAHIEKASKSVRESQRDGRKVVRTIQVLSELINFLEKIK
ncbi:MAG: hypothetical protein N3A69_11110 [Leptospiraceae bacterium]|nr:hypothetical protein [Leptospiraceae bacterium]